MRGVRERVSSNLVVKISRDLTESERSALVDEVQDAITGRGGSFSGVDQGYIKAMVPQLMNSDDWGMVLLKANLLDLLDGPMQTWTRIR